MIPQFILRKSRVQASFMSRKGEMEMLREDWDRQTSGLKQESEKDCVSLLTLADVSPGMRFLQIFDKQSTFPLPP